MIRVAPPSVFVRSLVSTCLSSVLCPLSPAPHLPDTRVPGLVRVDSSTALTVMQVVSTVASHGTTVVCSLHQPRPQVFNLLDTVVLLSRGRVAFLGAPSEAAPYFESVGRPFPNASFNAYSSASAAANAGDVGAALGEISPADAMLDAVGDAEIAQNLREKNHNGIGGGGRGGLIVMSPRVLLEKVREAPY